MFPQVRLYFLIKNQKAKEEADRVLTHELSRLEALRAVNPNIRDDEVEAIENERAHILNHLDEATWRLDSDIILSLCSGALPGTDSNPLGLLTAIICSS